MRRGGGGDNGHAKEEEEENDMPVDFTINKSKERQQSMAAPQPQPQPQPSITATAAPPRRRRGRPPLSPYRMASLSRHQVEIFTRDAAAAATAAAAEAAATVEPPALTIEPAGPATSAAAAVSAYFGPAAFHPTNQFSIGDSTISLVDGRGGSGGGGGGNSDDDDDDEVIDVQDVDLTNAASAGEAFHKPYTKGDMRQALDALKMKRLTLTRASELYGIPPTTLWQRANRSEREHFDFPRYETCLGKIG